MLQIMRIEIYQKVELTKLTEDKSISYMGWMERVFFSSQLMIN